MYPLKQGRNCCGQVVEAKVMFGNETKSGHYCTFGDIIETYKLSLIEDVD